MVVDLLPFDFVSQGLDGGVAMVPDMEYEYKKTGQFMPYFMKQFPFGFGPAEEDSPEMILETMKKEYLTPSNVLQGDLLLKSQK